MWWPLPAWLIESMNGWIALLFPWVILATLRHLWRRKRSAQTLREFYNDNQMAFALVVILTASELRSLTAWWVRFAASRGIEAVYETPVREIASATYLLATIMLIVGAVCWSRVARDLPIFHLCTWALPSAALVAALWLTLW